MMHIPTVALVRSASPLWAKIPPDIRRDLEEGTARIEAIRANIVRSGKVKAMPYVRTHDEIWVNPGAKNLIFARATFLEADGRAHPLARVSAPVVLCKDQELVRAVLVHEFAHCFNFMTRVLDAFDAGLASLDLRTGTEAESDLEAEDAFLANPRDWFGPGDANNFLRWGDARIDSILTDERLLELAEYLPTGVPPREFSGDAVAFPSELSAHIRAMRPRKSVEGRNETDKGTE